MVAGPATIFWDISSVNDNPEIVNSIMLSDNSDIITVLSDISYISVSESYNNNKYPITIDLSATDIDTTNSASFEFIIVGLPKRGYLTDVSYDLNESDISHISDYDISGYIIKDYAHFITYTPNEGEYGLDEFTYCVIDNDLDTRKDAETGKDLIWRCYRNYGYKDCTKTNNKDY